VNVENTKSPGILISGRDGRVVAETALGRQLVGDVIGRQCGDVMGCPHRAGHPGCPTGPRVVKGRGGRFELRCELVEDQIVSFLSPAPAGEGTEWERLTPREQDVLKELAEGRTTGDIAGRLGISEATVRAHVEHMRLRLGVGTRAALVSRGYQLGYL
jgi:DNA-binding CsgD family transcriptional regulator